MKLTREQYIVAALLECIRYGHSRSSDWVVEEALPMQALVIWC